jgi:hypothetical protein
MNKVSFIKALLEMDEASFTKKYNDDPKLKGTKEEDSKLEEKVDMEELEMTLKRLKKENPGKEVTYSFIKDSPKGYVFYIDKKLVKEGQDHEVSMAQNSLKSIISAASQLMNSLGQDEKDIPAWIQDHITNAENYINQASKNYHEYNEGETKEDVIDAEPNPYDSAEEIPLGDQEDKEEMFLNKEMFLKNMMEDLFEAKKKKPSAGLTKKQKSSIVKQAQKGKDFGKKGPGFQAIVKKAKASGAKDPEAIAGAQFWKGQAKKAK